MAECKMLLTQVLHSVIRKLCYSQNFLTLVSWFQTVILMKFSLRAINTDRAGIS